MKGKKTIQRKYHLFNAEGKTLGRLATEIAKVLQGKNKVDYAPHIDAGDFAIVINSDRVSVTGNKANIKVYHHFSGYPGGVRTIAFKDQLERDSRKIIVSAVYGMLRKNKLRDKELKRLFVYKNDEHKHRVDLTH